MTTPPFYEDAHATVWHGDCVKVLAGMADNTFDAVITDPPYNLSDSGKRDTDCMRRVLLQIMLPDNQDRNGEGFKSRDLPSPPLGGPELRRVDGSSGIEPRVGMPERPVDIQDSPIVQQEIRHSDVPAQRTPDRDLAAEPYPESGERFGHYVFGAADGWDAAFCDGTCSCFLQPSPGLIAVPVALPRTSGSDLAGDLLSGWQRSYTDVWLRDHPGSEPKSAPPVVAGTGTVVGAMLRLDLGRRTAELVPTNDAGHQGARLLLVPAESVGASPRASGLATVPEPTRVRLVDDFTDGTFTVDIPWHNLKSTRQTGGFMGRTWDGWESPPAFQRWCQTWAAECLRVLKPGGALLAFGGTRTWHRLVCAIEDAGFEIRDSVAWLYGSGFPKSLDVSKAIDKAAGAEREPSGAPTSLACEFVRAGRHCEGHDGETATSQSGLTIHALPTAPATPEAQQWAGYGTSMKPGHEPVCVARKPLDGNVAGNVLRWGTGGVNIDAMRIGTREERPLNRNTSIGYGGSDPQGAVMDGGAGRWPANVALDEETAAALDQTVGDCPSKNGGLAAPGGFWGSATDGGSGIRRDDSGGPSRFFYTAKAPADERIRIRDDSGQDNATTYGQMPTRQCNACGSRTKAAGGDVSGRSWPTCGHEDWSWVEQQSAGEKWVSHPTVKPLDLMRWLVRGYAGPKGALILDPFAGSGTTGEAAIVEDMRVVLIEQDETYLPLIKARVTRRTDPVEHLRTVGEDLGLFGLEESL